MRRGIKGGSQIISYAAKPFLRSARVAASARRPAEEVGDVPDSVNRGVREFMLFPGVIPSDEAEQFFILSDAADQQQFYLPR